MPVSPLQKQYRDAPTAVDLCIPTPDVSPNTDNATVLQLFNKYKELVSLPVVENGRPFGLINRHIFLSQMSRPFYRELYDKKSCIAFMDKNPLIVDASASLNSVADQTVISGDKSLTDGFIITQNGTYLGIGLGIDLIKAVSDMHLQQHQHIMQSIEYASIIQRAMMAASHQAMTETLTDWCLTWQPRDCVGGDCYTFKTYDDGWLAVVIDCTGHGVPGAFMTLIFASALEQALVACGPRDPARLMQAINRYIKNTLGQLQDGESAARDNPSNDGCDMIIAFMDNASRRLTWANSRLAAFVLGPDESAVRPLAADRMGVGYTDTPYDYAWDNHQLTLTPQTLFFTTTDGLTDQVGGERRIMYGKRRLEALLLRHRALPMPALAQQLQQEHLQYQGQQPRRDDLTFWGFRQ